MRHLGIFALLITCLLTAWAATPAVADEAAPLLIVSGHVRNAHGEPVAGAHVELSIAGVGAKSAKGKTLVWRTDDEGAFLSEVLLTPQQAAELEQGRAGVIVRVSKATYEAKDIVVPPADIAREHDHFYARADLSLLRKPTPAVFLSAIILGVVYVLISLERMHRTAAALVGAAAVLIVSHIGGFFSDDFLILPFERAVSYIDLNVIFLLMAMMVLVTITARTGVFQWLAVAMYRRARGSPWRLVVLLIATTAVLSALLDNVTTMLLMVPVTIEIALILRLNALALLLPEVFASNIGGAATLIGDPPNLLIGSYAGLDFGAFLVYMAPACAIALLGLVALVAVLYRGQYHDATREEARALLQRLEREFRITERETLWRSLVVFGGVIILFLLASVFDMEASVPALLGMAVLLIWTKADIVQQLEAVEWPSLIFFIALFIVVGAAHETGVIQALAELVGAVAHGNLTIAIILIVWITATASMLIDNIPITATMLPVVAHLTSTLPDATNNILYWALAFGACLGGNGTVIGASANIITVGLAERAGFSVSFGDFARKGIPVTVVSLVMATAWLLLLAWLT